MASGRRAQTGGLSTATVPATLSLTLPPTDSDGDGMLDAYEKANDLLVLVDDAAEDKDGDGLTKSRRT